MNHGMIFHSGWARDWYWSLYQSIIDEHRRLPCRQGVALESPHSLTAVIQHAPTVVTALASVDVPRRPVSRNRIAFAIMDALRRLVGYHETVLFDKYPILSKYVQPVFHPYYSRITAYTREEIPTSFADEPWVRQITHGGRQIIAIDQLMRAVHILSSATGRFSRRALVDFGEGYRARCVMSWLFTIRDEELNIYTHMRSNDLMVGLPNDLVSARIAQIVMAACTGAGVGFLHHHADLVQIYEIDIAGQPCVKMLYELRELDPPETPVQTEDKITSISIVDDLRTVVEPYLNVPVMSSDDGLARYRDIMRQLDELFWLHNPECTTSNRQSAMR
jgi:hypothetical protein